jgi:Flp pilus assembly protein TadB
VLHHHFLKNLLHNFEENPSTQVKFHWAMMIFWIVNAAIGTVVAILWPHIWVAIGVLYVFLLSIYANWDTDYGAVSAAQASLKSEYLVSVQHQEPIDVTVEKVDDGE